MMCSWDALIGILPPQMRHDVDRLGRYQLQELRLRINYPAELVLKEGSKWIDMKCSPKDISYCIQAASCYSPWSSESMKYGYLTAPGGHRIGICGLAVYRDGMMTGIRDITSLCIRVARDYHGIAEGSPTSGSLLILGAPGWGKTTRLRDLIRQRSNEYSVAVVDERGELFPDGFDRGKRTDILRGCLKTKGIEQVLRTMSPGCIALDEITAVQDCESLIQIAGCGVQILATAHAGSLSEFLSRPLYRGLIEKGIFENVLVRTADKHFTTERITV